VGAIGLGLVAGVAAEHRSRVWPFVRRHATALAIAVLVLGIGGFAAMHAVGLLEPFRETPLWSAPNADRVTFYTTALMQATPLLWPLAPAAAVVACIVKPRLGITLVVTALVVLVAHSLAAAKATRYAYYAVPWLCSLLGIAVAIAAAWIRPAQARLVVGGLAACALLLSQEGWRTLRLAAGADGYARVLGYGDETDWSPALPALRAHLAAGDAVVVSNSMKGLWYLGRYDYELNASIVAETRSGEEFGVDRRTGRRVVSTPESVAAVLRERDRVLFVLETEKLGRPAGVPADTVALLAGACAPIATPPAARLTVWSCPATAAPPSPPASAD
jgi:hypothetical protein